MKQAQENIYNPIFVKDLFNKMSSSYERMNYITSFGFSIRWRRQLVNQFSSSNENLEIIDLLSGMGETWNFIHHKFPNSNLTALDFSEGMIKYAENKNDKHFNGKVKIINQDVLNNQLQSNFYDYVFCGFGLKTFNEIQLEILANEVKRILKPNGKFSFVDVSEPKGYLLKGFYEFYLKNIIPILGKIFLGNPETYKMLWKYTDGFKNAKKANDIFVKAGLKSDYQEYFFGCATGFTGIKKQNHDPR